MDGRERIGSNIAWQVKIELMNPPADPLFKDLMTKLLTEWPDSFSTSNDSSIFWLSLNQTNGGDGFPEGNEQNEKERI